MNKKTLKAANAIFAKGLKELLVSNGEYESTDRIDDIDFEIDYFLDKNCLAYGTEDDMKEIMQCLIREEIERRMSHFECATEDDRSFLLSCIKEYVLRGVTMIKGDSMFSSFLDSFNYTMYECNGIYFIMDFSEAEYDWKFYFDEYITDAVHIVYEIIKNNE